MPKEAVARAPEPRVEMLATEPRVQIPDSAGARPQKTWTTLRLALVVAVGFIPVATLFLQPGTTGLMAATAIELTTAVVAFRVWVPRET